MSLFAIPTRRALLGGKAVLPQYLLYDAFTDTLAAGAVNGTLSTPPVTVALTGAAPARTVTDTNSTITVGSGVLALSGTPAANDGLLYAGAPITRKLGQAVIFDLPNSVTEQNANGFMGLVRTASITGAQADGFLPNAPGSSATSIKDNNATGPSIVGLGTATTLALVLRAAGCYFYQKIATTWTLLWIAAGDATATLYIAKKLSTNAINTQTDNIRVPVTLYIPSPLAYDTFTRADGVLGSTEAAGPDAQAAPSLAWTSTAGTWGVATNKAAASALAGGLALATVSTPTADILLDATCTRSAGVVGIVARYQASTDYLIAYHDGTNCKLDKVVAGVTTNLISAAVAIGAGALRLILSGTSAWLFLNGTAVGSVAAVPSSVLAAHGLYTTDTGATFDNFQVFARGTSNEFTLLGSPGF